MTAKLAHVIAFVDDIEDAIGFYRDHLGLTPRSVSPSWVEFDTGATTLALHIADQHNPSGTTSASFAVRDVGELHRKLTTRGLKFRREPIVQHGQQLAELLGPGGARIGLSSPVAAQAAKPAPAAGAEHAPHPRFTRHAQEVKQRIQEISADELTKLRERGPVVVIDVREESEWKQGHLAGAVHIPRGVLEPKIEAAVPDLDARVVVYCAGGNRGALAAESLQKFGYANVASLTGGFRGWQDAGRPVEGK
jgi:rhodanese-related sulfurtransferase/extradiol dioxygenase family protein